MVAAEKSIDPKEAQPIYDWCLNEVDLIADENQIIACMIQVANGEKDPSVGPDPITPAQRDIFVNVCGGRAKDKSGACRRKLTSEFLKKLSKDSSADTSSGPSADSTISEAVISVGPQSGSAAPKTSSLLTYEISLKLAYGYPFGGVKPSAPFLPHSGDYDKNPYGDAAGIFEVSYLHYWKQLGVGASLFYNPKTREDLELPTTMKVPKSTIHHAGGLLQLAWRFNDSASCRFGVGFAHAFSPNTLFVQDIFYTEIGDTRHITMNGVISEAECSLESSGIPVGLVGGVQYYALWESTQLTVFGGDDSMVTWAAFTPFIGVKLHYGK